MWLAVRFPEGTLASLLGLPSMLEAPPFLTRICIRDPWNPPPWLICAFSGLCHLKRLGELPKVIPSVFTRARDGRGHICLHRLCPSVKKERLSLPRWLSCAFPISLRLSLASSLALFVLLLSLGLLLLCPLGKVSWIAFSGPAPGLGVCC